MTQQLNLIPEKVATPKYRKVFVEELPQDLLGSLPSKSFIESVRRFGVIEPVGLIENGSMYTIAYGRRRIKAARQLKLISIPAMIYPLGWTPAEVLALIENQHRSENVVAKLEAIDTLRREATPEEICHAIGINKIQLNQAVHLLDGLIPALQDALRENRMAVSTAKKALKLEVDQQREVAQLPKIKANDVEQYLKAKVKSNVESLPDSLFGDVPTLGWQRQAIPLLEQLLEVIPESHPAYLSLQEVQESLAVRV
ncbi:MAG: ParB N-terminal domain-containing protein [Acaryochloris sp. RU_4_1]|nr:ParB N-terminal domain-containing protein [Acaryochloris sp. RU_4_1]NJR55662.1 ParB N-terminal domain-containing protein [Acaryochloris sp. CRU_2_0]